VILSQSHSRLSLAVSSALSLHFEGIRQELTLIKDILWGSAFFEESGLCKGGATVDLSLGPQLTER
jgi:hypothetical protein